MKTLFKSPAFWAVFVVAIVITMYAFKKGKRKILIARIEERFGQMPNLNEKTSEELEQILRAK